MENEIKDSPQPQQPTPEYTAFDTALGRALAVPKAEIDRREKEWREKRRKKRPGSNR